MTASQLLATYDSLQKSDFNWLESEVMVRIERFVARFNYMAQNALPIDDEQEIEKFIDEASERYNLPRGLWDEADYDCGTKLPLSFASRALPLVKKWVRGTMTPDEWTDLAICLDEDHDTDMVYFLYGVPHAQVIDGVDIDEHAEKFAGRNQRDMKKASRTK